MRVLVRIGCVLLAIPYLLSPLGARAENPVPAQLDAPLGGETQRSPHPEPRVIVNVLSVQGPHDRKSIESFARLGWGRIVKCYEAVARGDRGKITLELRIASAGKVLSARRIASTLKNAELAACVTNAMNGLTMPKAHARSIAATEIHVAPGDRG